MKESPDDLNGIYSELALIVGMDNVRQIFDQYKGQQITFPMRLYSKQSVEEKIISEFTGSNFKELSQKYNYSERWVRIILKENRGDGK